MTNDEKNMGSARTSFSMEEIQKMLGEIDSLVSTHQAKEKGLAPSQMVKTVRGGKVVWITVEQMNVMLSKRRKISGEKYRCRTLRGQDSLSNEVTKRIETCRRLILALQDAEPEQANRFRKYLRYAQALHNRSLSHASDLRIIEAAIQRKKQEDPIIKQVEEATTNMVKAIQSNRIDDVNTSQSFCDRHLDEYVIKQRRLEPYIRQANNYRYAFLETKQKIFRLELEIIEQGVKALQEPFIDLKYYSLNKESNDEFLSLSQNILEEIEKGRPVFEQIAQISPQKMDDEKELLNEADKTYITPLYEKMHQLLALFQREWVTLHVIQKIDTTDSGFENSKKPDRMIFQKERKFKS